MTARKPPRRTRERILAASLELFNRDGVPRVTTAHIADELSISPGNLYYHFRNKDEIVRELYGVFDTEVRQVASVPEEGPVDVEDLWLFLHLLFERMERYRFLFRDLAELTARHPHIAVRFAKLLQLLESALLTMCKGMVAGGSMRISDAELSALAKNALVVATLWMSFARIALLVRTEHVGEPDLGRAAYQVLVLIAPYLDGPARALLERLARNYV